MTTSKEIPRPMPLTDLWVTPAVQRHTTQLASSYSAKTNLLNDSYNKANRAYREARDVHIESIRDNETPNERARLLDLRGGWSTTVCDLDQERRKIKTELDARTPLTDAFAEAVRAPAIIDAATLDLQDPRVLAIYQGATFFPTGKPELKSADPRLALSLMRANIVIEIEKQ